MSGPPRMVRYRVLVTGFAGDRVLEIWARSAAVAGSLALDQYRRQTGGPGEVRQLAGVDMGRPT